jgi:hypothetical protein
MSCAHRDRTVAWCHGEADDGLLAHLASCAECRETVAELEDVWAVVAGRVDPPAIRSNRRMWAWAAAAVAVAAAAALWAGRPPPPPQAPPAPAMEAVDADLVDLELALDALDSDLADL